MTVGIHAPSRSGPDAPHERSSPPVSQPTPAGTCEATGGPRRATKRYAAREEEHRERRNGTNQARDDELVARILAEPPVLSAPSGDET